MKQVELTQEMCDAIRDALEMRIRECKAHAASLRGDTCTEATKRLALTFEETARKAELTYTKLEELDVI